MSGGFSLVARRCHTCSHAAVNLPSLSPWRLSLVRKSVWHLEAMSIGPRPPFSVRRCRVERENLRIVPFLMYQDMAVANCRTCSLETGNTCAICHILASKLHETQVSAIHVPRQCSYLSRHPRQLVFQDEAIELKTNAQNGYDRALGDAHHVNRRVP